MPLSISLRIKINSISLVWKGETSVGSKLHVEESCRGNTNTNLTQLSAKLSHRSRTNALDVIQQWNVGLVSEHLVSKVGLLEQYTSEDISSAEKTRHSWMSKEKLRNLYLNGNLNNRLKESRFQIFAVFWMLYSSRRFHGVWIYVPTFRDSLFHLHKWGKIAPPMKMELKECSETSAHKIQTPGNH